MKLKLNIIHPIFTIKGGAEKVIIDMADWATPLFDVELFSVFGKPKVNKYISVEYASDDLFLSSVFGFKANPFIKKHIKRLARIVASKCTSQDIFILSNCC